MKQNIFLYKILTYLNKNGLNEIKLEDFKDFHENFIIILKEYKLDLYVKCFRNLNTFLNNILLVFCNFELGVYTNKIMHFYEYNICQNIYKNVNIDDDTIINEISLYFLYYIKEKNNSLKK